MKKKLYYVQTNGFDYVASVDEEKNTKQLFQNKYFPYTSNNEEDKKLALEFLESIEDDIDWEDIDYEDLLKDLEPDYEMVEPPIILAEIEKEL